MGPLKASKENNLYKYKFVQKAKENQVLKFVPHSENILFQPEWVEYKTINDCAENAVQFVGEKGLIIEGGVDPPLSNVKITIKTYETNMNGTEIVQITKSDGKYKFGPLKNSIKYEYVFRSENKNLLR